MSSSKPPAADCHHRPDALGKSSGECSGAVPCDPKAFRRAFRDRWGEFLRAHFHNHLHVAVFFGVDEKTARLWWNFTNEPRGWAVSYALSQFPKTGCSLLEVEDDSAAG